MSDPLFRNTGLNYASIHESLGYNLAGAMANRRRAAISLAEFLLNTFANDRAAVAEAQDSLCRGIDRLHKCILDEEKARVQQAPRRATRSTRCPIVPDKPPDFRLPAPPVFKLGTYDLGVPPPAPPPPATRHEIGCAGSPFLYLFSAASYVIMLILAAWFLHGTSDEKPTQKLPSISSSCTNSYQI